jgi:hypothetical protein
LSNLSPGTIYHFSLIATNSDGTTRGADEEFAIPASFFTGGVSTVLYTTFGPNYADAQGEESRIIQYTYWLAMPFTTKVAGTLGRIVVPVYNVFSPDRLRFTLTTDNNGLPGTTLETWSLTGLSGYETVTMNSRNFPALTNGVQYWLEATADSSGTEDGWWMGPLGGATPSSNWSSTNQGANWFFTGVTDCAFEVDAANPLITGVATAGTSLTLTATNGIAGQTYVTLRGTNITEPLNLWQPVATNLVGVSGAFSILATNAVNTNGPQQYYILRTTP